MGSFFVLSAQFGAVHFLQPLLYFSFKDLPLNTCADEKILKFSKSYASELSSFNPNQKVSRLSFWFFPIQQFWYSSLSPTQKCNRGYLCLPSKEGGAKQLVCFVTEGSLLQSNISAEGGINKAFYLNIKSHKVMAIEAYASKTLENSRQELSTVPLNYNHNLYNRLA